MLSPQQASRYRRRYEGRRIPPQMIVSHPPQPDLIASQHTLTQSALQNLEPNTIQRMLEMQLTLDRSLSSLDTSHISIGVNRAAQSPQDLTLNYSEGCQTDIVMVQDISTDTQRITLDSSVQCASDTLEMYTQTETVFKKNKHLQTGFINVNGTSQTDKPKTRNSCVQTQLKSKDDKSLQVTKDGIDFVDASTEMITHIMCDKQVETETLLDTSENNVSRKDFIQYERSKEKSDSPPLSSDKELSAAEPHYSFSLVSIFSPMAVRLPRIGTYNYCFL